MKCISFERSAPLSLKENTKTSNSISINLSKLDDFKDILDFYEFKKYSPLKDQQNFYKLFSISIFSETHRGPTAYHHRKFYNTTLTKVNEDLMSLEIHYYYFNEFPLSNSEIRELKLENRQSKLNNLLNK